MISHQICIIRTSYVFSTSCCLEFAPIPWLSRTRNQMCGYSDFHAVTFGSELIQVLGVPVWRAPNDGVCQQHIGGLLFDLDNAVTNWIETCEKCRFDLACPDSQITPRYAAWQLIVSWFTSSENSKAINTAVSGQLWIAHQCVLTVKCRCQWNVFLAPANRLSGHFTVDRQ
jgi:hypothetical protein